MANTTIKVDCGVCRKTHTVVVPTEDYKKWKAGAFVQDAFPYLDAGTRELFISGVCDECFTKMFK